MIYESLKEALDSDGTPWITVTDAQIQSGALLNPDGSPKYPILFSLAAEAIDDAEIAPLLDYVDGGGFLFVGSSAFTRNPDGSSRGNFAIASEMGLNSLNSWYQNIQFTKVQDHRLVAHVPAGTLTWRMVLNSDEIVWSHSGAHYVWQVTANGAEVLANGGSGPILATRGYGGGRFLYHGALNPLIGHGGYDSGMYSYVIYRRAIEWAFENANLPIVKRSPWQYPYDAAFLARHDFENWGSAIQGIEASAQAEHSIGAKGDYYFCTGTLREEMGNDPATIESLQRAVSLYGATIGSHNGGLPNPTNPGLPIGAYDYWHWGPDQALDVASPPLGYSTGWDYAYASIEMSFLDIESWLSGEDNGRPGCGAAGNCPRTWVSPYFNSGREDSCDILEQLSSATMGEQKISPYPHWTLSYETFEERFDHVSLSLSDWYVGTTVAQALDQGHSSSSMHALVDFYYQLGALVNIYSHLSSTGGLQWDYINYAASKANMWKTNAVGIYDWWVDRSGVMVTPSFSKNGGTAITTVGVSGATDPETAIELVIPYWSTGLIANLQVYLDGAPAAPSEYRTTDYGVKVRVGTGVSDVQVRYTPLDSWVQTDWIGGDGQSVWSDPTMFDSSSNVDISTAGRVCLPLDSGGDVLFSDDFTRPPDPPPVPFTWITSGITGNYGLFNTDGGTLNCSTSVSGQYGYAYKDVPSQPAGDYTVEADMRFPNAGSFGGGIYGRLDPATGTRYAIWIYPGSSILRLIRFTNWSGWTGLGDYAIPAVGSGWHHVKMVFSGTNIQVYYDGGALPTHNVNDASYATGYVGVDFWTSGNTYGPSYNNYVVTDNLGNELFSDDFGPDPGDNLAPWTVVNGLWTVAGGIMQGSASSGYGNVQYQPGTTWDNYSVEGQIQFPSGAFGGGLGGRVDPATGAHYAAWVYPDGSSGGSNVLRLVKFHTWTTWSNTPMQQVSLPSVGTGWHTLKLDFDGARIRVYYDGNLAMDVTDNDFDSRAPYLTGGISADLSIAAAVPYGMQVDDVVVRSPATYSSPGTLLSSAFDGGVGVDWHTISWDAAAGGVTSARLRTRTADRAEQLASAPWSAYWTTSGDSITNENKRWIQYEVELSSSDPFVTPCFYEVRISYVPGILLPGSNLTYLGAVSADSETEVLLPVTLTDDDGLPVVGRLIQATLDGVNGTLTSAALTNGSGQANITMDLLTAPGFYTLSFAFAGDGYFAPSSHQAPFEVTSPWSDWIHDTQTDFETGTPTDVDLTTEPGRVLLQYTLTGEGEESGSFSVGGEQGWTYRRRLFVDNPNATELPAGYSAKLVLDTHTLVTEGKLRSDGLDLRLVWDNSGTPIQLDRLALSPFDDPNTEIWFKVQAAIPANDRDGNYYIYYGNPGAGAPPEDPSNVWALWDTFDGSLVDTSLWAVQGSVSVSGGQAHLGSGGSLFSVSSFTYGTLEMRIQTGGENNYMWWGWEDGISDAPNFLVFEEWPVPTNFTALYRNDGAPYIQLPIADPDGGLTTWHTYATDWAADGAHWLIDGSHVAGITTSIPDSPQNLVLHAHSVAFDVDWVRARLRVAQEPVVSLSVPELGYLASGSLLSVPYYAGGLAVWKYLNWEAMTPSGTSLLVRLRTADTEAELGTAEWVEYSHTGQLVTNAQGCWAQYELLLATSTPTATPALDRMILYYDLVPTAVTLASFAAEPGAAGILLTWETAVEIDNLGFNLYRSNAPDGEYIRLNEGLIPSQAPGSLQGAVYYWEDAGVDPGGTYYYKLEAIDLYGAPTVHGPVSAAWPAQPAYAVYLPLVTR